jgi:hypothetical protein
VSNVGFTVVNAYLANLPTSEMCLAAVIPAWIRG